MSRPLAVVAWLLCLITLLAACGQSTASQPSPAGTPDSSRSAFQQAREAEEAEEQDSAKETQATVTVEENEWRIVVPTAEADAEDIKFVVTNRGSRPHAFGIRQNGAPVAFMDDLKNIQPGESQTLVATLHPGDYELLDPGSYDVNGRRVTGDEMGMRVAFKVV